MANYQTQVGLRRNDVAIAYVLLRILFGIGFFNIGFSKIRGIGGFANAMVDQFKNTFLPADLVRITAAIVPPAEVIIGLLLIFGLATRGALIAGFLLMMILQAGVTLLQNWDTAANQLIYCIIFFLLLAGVGFNRFSLDRLIHHKRNSSDVEQKPDSTLLGFIQRPHFRRRDRKRFIHSVDSNS